MPLSTYHREDDPSVLTEDLIANEDLGGIKKFLHLIRQERYHIRAVLSEHFFRNNYDVACPMNFRKYPYDTQICKVKYESCKLMMRPVGRDFNFQMVEEDNLRGLQQLNNFTKLHVGLWVYICPVEHKNSTQLL